MMAFFYIFKFLLKFLLYGEKIIEDSILTDLIIVWNFEGNYTRHLLALPLQLQ